MIKDLKNRSLVTILETSKDKLSNPEDQSKWNIVDSPPPSNKRFEVPPELEFTPIPGMKMVCREEYERIMNETHKMRVTENLPTLEDSDLVKNDFAAMSLDTRNKLSNNKPQPSPNAFGVTPGRSKQRFSEMIENRERLWFAVPDNDPYRVPSQKEVQKPLTSPYGDDDFDLLTPYQGRSQAERSDCVEPLRVSDILGGGEESEIEEMQKYQRAVFDALTPKELDVDLTDDFFDAVVHSYILKFFDLISQQN